LGSQLLESNFVDLFWEVNLSERIVNLLGIVSSWQEVVLYPIAGTMRSMVVGRAELAIVEIH
jgi:hypothetical protein